MSSDSRISDGAGVIIDEGGKIFTVPLIVQGPGPDNFFNLPYFRQDIGLGCVGATLIFQYVYACLVPLFSSLHSDGVRVPALEDVAEAAASVATKYVQSLGQRTPQAHHVRFVVCGGCHAHEALEAYELGPVFVDSMFDRFEATQLELEGGRTYFYGDHIDAAHARLVQLRSETAVPIFWHRAPTKVIREFAERDDIQTIGGDVQLGFTAGYDFTRVTTTSPLVPGKPVAVMRLNNIAISDLVPVGPCAYGMTSMLGL